QRPRPSRSGVRRIAQRLRPGTRGHPGPGGRLAGRAGGPTGRTRPQRQPPPRRRCRPTRCRIGRGPPRLQPDRHRGAGRGGRSDRPPGNRPRTCPACREARPPGSSRRGTLVVECPR
ncbi:MAG: hypothetical protein ACK55I_39365, partial [bacterium]